MGTRDQTPAKWINPLLEKFDLVQPRRIAVDLRLLWTELEEFRVPERIRTTVAEINREAGGHVLDLLDYLPPQRKVLRVVYTKDKVEYVMAVLLRSGVPAVAFHSASVATTMWSRYLPSRTKTRLHHHHPLEIVRGFRPSEVTDEIIQHWFTFLLSRLSKEFEGQLHQDPFVRRDSNGKSFFHRDSA